MVKAEPGIAHAFPEKLDHLRVYIDADITGNRDIPAQNRLRELGSAANIQDTGVAEAIQPEPAGHQCQQFHARLDIRVFILLEISPTQMQGDFEF